MPSKSESISGVPQPHTPTSYKKNYTSANLFVGKNAVPGCVFAGSCGHMSLQSGVESRSVSVSATPQPHSPAERHFNGSCGHTSAQSHTPSRSVSISELIKGLFVLKDAQIRTLRRIFGISATPHPHIPGEILSLSNGHMSRQSQSKSPSVSMSGTAQPHTPGSVLKESRKRKETERWNEKKKKQEKRMDAFKALFGHPSRQSKVPSKSVSKSGMLHPQTPTGPVQTL